MSTESLFRLIDCCACGKPIDKSKHINLVELPYVTKWNYPYCNNVLSQSQDNHAAAVLCDDCIKLHKAPKYAIEFKDHKVIYHLITELENN